MHVAWPRTACALGIVTRRAHAPSVIECVPTVYSPCDCNAVTAHYVRLAMHPLRAQCVTGQGTRPPRRLPSADGPTTADGVGGKS